MTKREAAIVGAYTGFLLGKFSDMHAYIEQVMGRSVQIIEMGMDKDFQNKLRELTKADFVSIRTDTPED